MIEMALKFFRATQSLNHRIIKHHFTQGVRPATWQSRRILRFPVCSVKAERDSTYTKSSRNEIFTSADSPICVTI